MEYFSNQQLSAQGILLFLHKERRKRVKFVVPPTEMLLSFSIVQKREILARIKSMETTGDLKNVEQFEVVLYGQTLKFFFSQVK